MEKGFDNLMVPFMDNLIAVRQAVKTFFQRRIKELDSDISYEMFQVLNVLWRKNEVNQQEIANAVQKGKASLTPLIDNLVKLQLVTRTEDSVDRRNKIITLTKEGQAFQKKMDPIFNDFYTQFGAGLSEKEIQTATIMLSKILSQVNN
ncbi:MarR family transcriptional regulator [Mucilaginibacter sp. cycad4]|uniref:MarR family winged helix-turn-helix transcriptional regulator n=1 Tax=Mucilaginibacter sp. cycad4 TaxID=3342096 RepID=UPI002AAC35F5|nr:MarR family transcriptional regulator [Mucilaginibacter gossypii]WPV01556.1 MarR family transcriptional regulator [Mucilaginibacter gossypii]